MNIKKFLKFIALCYNNIKLNNSSNDKLYKKFCFNNILKNNIDEYLKNKNK